jgi:hypothetical protein
MRLCVNRRNLRLIVDLVFVVAVGAAPGSAPVVVIVVKVPLVIEIADDLNVGASLSYGIRERQAKNQTQITLIVAEWNAALR